MSRSPQAVPMPHRQQAVSSQANVPSEYRPSATGNIKHDPYKLDSLFSNDLVRYKCSCGKYCRLNRTYFCRHCMAMRCKTCVAYEVDSQYCQHCLEYIPTIDPKFQMNKCASCYQCPSCQHLLSTSILSIAPSSSEQQLGQSDDIIKRTSKLICEFCRWSSQTFDTEDLQTTEVPHSTRIAELISFYKTISEREKTDKKKRRFHTRGGNTMDLLKKYGIDNTLSPQLFESLRARTTSKYILAPKAHEEAVVESFKPAEAIQPEQLEKLDTNYYYSADFDISDANILLR